MSLSKNPAYNLKAVLQETNIAADTLRAWERRYGLPMPQRTAGGHRLYSQYDIETIKWLLARQAEGLSISRAVDAWNEKISTNSDPLAEFTQEIFTAPLQGITKRIPEASLEALRSKWLMACLVFNETKAETALNEAFAMHPMESVCLEVLQKGLAEMGQHWYQNRASVQQEHFASGLAMRRLYTLISATPPPSRNQTVLVGCPPNEWHTFTPLLLAFLLRRRGLNVVYLGANVPADRFEETVSSIKANLVILVSQTLVSASNLQLTALALSGLRVPIGFGGRIFNLQQDMADHIPGFYLGNSVASSLEEVERLLKGKAIPSATKTTAAAYLDAHQAFVVNRTHIESTIKEMVQNLPISAEGLNTGLQFLGDNIAAALQLGDIEYVTNEMEWLKVLLQSHERPSAELIYFMRSYSQAVDKHINGQGEPIKVWLKAQASIEV